MAFLSKAGGDGGGFEPVPEGTHIARCVTVVDLGLQEGSYKGNVTWKEKVYLAFEVPSQRVKWTDKEDKEHEGPALVSATLTNSTYHMSILTKLVTSWRGKSFTDEEQKNGFDLFKLLDKPCQISVTHNHVNDKVYANISGIIGIPPGLTIPKRETDLLAWCPGDSEKAEALDRMPKWMKDKVTIGHRLVQTDNGGMPEAKGPQETYSGDPGYDEFDDISF